MRIKLQSQPFRVLIALLSRPGEVITREELQVQIWGEHTTVDFERGIASAMNKLREALGDSAESPRYVETLAKRGYRFIAPVVIESAQNGLALQPTGFSQASPEPAGSPDALGAEPVAAAAVRAVAEFKSVHAASPPAASGDRRSSRKGGTLPWLVPGGLALVILSCLATLLLVHWAARSKQVIRPARITQLTQGSEIYDGPPNPENLLTMVSDGPRIYTSLMVGGRVEIGSVDLSGTGLQPINLPDELRSVAITDISRDGSRLIVRGQQSRESEQPLWIVPTSGSSALRVGDVLAHAATFMPGGTSILYATGDELDVAQLDTGALSRFATVPGRAFWLRWSPAGDRLRFTMLDPLTHTPSLWEMDAATRHLQPVRIPAVGGMSVCCGSWTGDGRTYVFQASNAGESNIWSMGTGPRPKVTELTNGPLLYASPMTSREATSVFFVGLDRPAGTRLYDAKLHRFVPAPPFLARARRVAYSRDGRWVAWVDVDGRLWRARSSDGSGRLRLTPDDADVFLAHWSPDESQLVMMARKEGETWQIFTVDAAGGVMRQILADRRNLADPDWSADGKEIVFGREADLMGKESGPHDIEILNLASRAITALPGSANLFSPRWSPDGRWIVALSLDQTRLLLYDVAARTWKTLFTGSAADPVWSLDSKAVYFHAFADPSSAILRAPVSGGTAQTVADLSDLGLPTVDSYFFGGVTPEGAPIIEPRIGTGNLFSVQLPN